MFIAGCYFGWRYSQSKQRLCWLSTDAELPFIYSSSLDPHLHYPCDLQGWRSLFIPTWTEFLEVNWSQRLLRRAQNTEVWVRLGNGALTKCPTECPIQCYCHRMCLSAFLMFSWGQCLWPLSFRALHVPMALLSSDSSLRREAHSCSVLGGMCRFSVLHLTLRWRVGTAFFILCFICIQGLDKVLRAGEAFPLLQGSWGHCGMSPRALCAPAQTQWIAMPWPSCRKGPCEEEEGPVWLSSRLTPEQDIRENALQGWFRASGFIF